MRCGVQSRCRKRPPQVQECALAHSFFAKDPAESRNSSHWNLRKESHIVGKGGRQMSEKPKYYITTAIAYTSGKPHIGNTYEVVLADAIARYKRSQGYDVFFQTGTDEHGQKIELKAEEAGITPKEFVDNVSTEIKRIWDLMNTSYDKFIRTTDEDHEKQVKKILKKNVRKRRHLQRTLRRNVLYTM